MNILAIDTSNQPLSVAVANQSGVVQELTIDEKTPHSIQAMPAIEQLLMDCQLDPQMLNRIVVAKGPGSYTGVRIGVTIAKTLAWTLGIELVGVSSLETMAMSERTFNGYISPIFDARRGQIYTSLFKSDSEITNRLIRIHEDQIIQSLDWAKALIHLDAPIIFVGIGMAAHRELLQEALQEKVHFSEKNLPQAGQLALLGMELSPEENIHSFVPEYVRLAEAEAKWREKQL